MDAGEALDKGHTERNNDVDVTLCMCYTTDYDNAARNGVGDVQVQTEQENPNRFVKHSRVIVNEFIYKFT